MELRFAPRHPGFVRCWNRLLQLPTATGYRAAYRQWMIVFAATEATHALALPELGRRWPARAGEAADLFMLSPAFHLLVASAAKRAGHAQDARNHATLSDVLCGLILGSGHGTVAAPFLVVHPADEYAVCAFLGWEPGCQSLIVCEHDRYLDRLADEDGREMHFDMTPFLRPQPAGVGALTHPTDTTETGHRWSARWSS